jgi:hypothetical protein
MLCAGAGAGRAEDPAAALHARYLALQAQLADNQFRRPLHLASSEGEGKVAGDIHALIDSPFDAAASALGSARDWCDILLLHLNTKGCRVAGTEQAPILSLWIGRNRQQALAEASRVDFAFRAGASSGKYQQVRLDAGAGPMGTRDYRIALEAIPVENGKTFIHLGYSYGYDGLGRLALQTYLATAGRDKVGFTVIGAQPDGRSRHIGGVRGVVERNAMRYYAAIEAFLGARSGSPQVRFDKRVRDWHAMTELYPRQLREIGQAEYLEMKRVENLR